MPSIDQVVRVSDVDANGNANYAVTVTPDLVQPGHGVVTDAKGHSSDWDSKTGDPVATTIFGTPPFQAKQFQMSVSAHAFETHELSALPSPSNAAKVAPRSPSRKTRKPSR
jgi:hypothetical protein